MEGLSRGGIYTVHGYYLGRGWELHTVVEKSFSKRGEGGGCKAGMEALVAQAKYGDIMPIIVRVEKFKDSQNKACLSSLLCHLMCPGYFGSDFLIFFWLSQLHNLSSTASN